jgi:hypothetical protein
LVKGFLVFGRKVADRGHAVLLRRRMTRRL